MDESQFCDTASSSTSNQRTRSRDHHARFLALPLLHGIPSMRFRSGPDQGTLISTNAREAAPIAMTSSVPPAFSNHNGTFAVHAHLAAFPTEVALYNRAGLILHEQRLRRSPPQREERSRLRWHEFPINRFVPREVVCTLTRAQLIQSQNKVTEATERVWAGLRPSSNQGHQPPNTDRQGQWYQAVHVIKPNYFPSPGDGNGCTVKSTADAT